MQQLPLSISLRDDATFSSFYSSPDNQLAVQALRQLQIGEDYGLVYLCAAPASGSSHLLQAACHQCPESVYLPLGELIAYAPQEVFTGLEHQPLVCLDELGAVAGNGDWEEALFNFLNRKMLLGGVVLVAAVQPAAQLFHLPDLVSRFQQGLVLGLAAPGDEDKARIFSWRGQQRGMHIPEEVANFVLRHFSRDLHRLMALLDDLDAQSLKQQRRITIPFVRQLVDAQLV